MSNKSSNLATMLQEYLNSQDLYKKYTTHCVDWKLMFDEDDYQKTLEFINDMYKIYDNNLIPLMRDFSTDDFICEFEGKYLLIHLFASPGSEKRKVLNTPEEVWNNIIKPKIESYFS